VGPAVGAQIVLDLDTGRGVLVGLRTVSAVVRPPLRSVGVRLTGAGLFSIVGPDAGQVVDGAVDLDAVATPAVLARCRDQGFPPDAVVGLVAGLCTRFVPDPRVVFVERELRRGASAREAARLVDMDRRHFVPLFRQQIGINPKTYERLVRYNRVLATLRDGSGRTIAAIAAEHGYADQAHLTRELRELAATTPRRLTRLPSGPVNHLPLDDTTR
jgi:AraC-like DNA-binding protein